MDPYILYAMPGSLYSGKARSYLRKHRIEYVERVPGDPRYNDEVVPAIGRWIIPVLQTPDGTLVQDTVDIIDLLDADVDPARSAYPATPTQRAVAHLLELFGGEGLLRPAMHYRWDFDDTNLAFLSKDFSASLALRADDETRDGVFAFSSARMRSATTAFGVSEDLVPEIERSYEEFLDLFDAHLAGSPYLLGGRPTIADFGFMGPLFAHLARDPYPSVLMKQRAQRVWRWVERMNAPVLDASEYGDCSEDLFADDAVPDTLRALLAYIGEEYLDEALAQVVAVDGWLAEHPDVADGEIVLGKPNRRFSGTTTFSWRGRPMTVAVVPYRLYLLKRLQDAVAAAPDGRSAVRSVFAAAGLDPLLDVRPRRWVERADNHEVWGELQEPVLPD
ncbi:MAG: glutathione S-transferase [Acidimicrobiales bacterium]|jgi:glutathione S-transferase